MLVAMPKTNAVGCRKSLSRRGAVAVLAAWCAGAVAQSAAPGGNDRSAQMGASPKPAAAPGVANADTLVTMFPGELAGWQQKVLERPLPAPVPAPRAAVRAVYTQAAHSAEITVDTGKPDASLKGKRNLFRQGPPQVPEAMVSVSFANGVTIAATSRSADAAALEALVNAIDLARVEALTPARR